MKSVWTSYIKKTVMVMSFVACWSIFNAHAQNLTVFDKLKNLESTTEGRLGIFALNTENGDIIEYRANEIFPTGCTSKVIGVSAILKKSMNDPLLLSTKVKFSKEDLENWSPVTQKFVSEGMTVQELCAASISYSDNTSMNLLLKHIGGTQGMNDFARSMGDSSFSQDNDWPAEAFSGGVNNVKDASTPKAMVESFRHLTMGTVLGDHQKNLLTQWLIDTNTGAARIRSGIPKGWLVGNKTGTGGAYGSTNDLAIIWPSKHEPLLIGIYYTSDNKKAIMREDVVCDATKMIVAAFMMNDKKLAVETQS